MNSNSRFYSTREKVNEAENTGYKIEKEGNTNLKIYLTNITQLILLRMKTYRHPAANVMFHSFRHT
jgi:lipid-binding SYLF domain-containing protein